MNNLWTFVHLPTKFSW